MRPSRFAISWVSSSLLNGEARSSSFFGVWAAEDGGSLLTPRGEATTRDLSPDWRPGLCLPEGPPPEVEVDTEDFLWGLTCWGRTTAPEKKSTTA